ncbi:PcfB family protein [Oscillospiraceae bacterium 42-9]
MTNSGDAAEQIVRMSLEGTEVALKLTGSAAKNLAAALYAVLKNRDKNKIKGRQRLTAMLKSGKELKVFTISESHLKQFSVEAKRYGVVYCALRGKQPSADGLVDVMVRAEDASKINRIVERFKLATVDTASIKHEIEKSKAEKESATPPPEQSVPDTSDDQLLDDMLGAPMKKEENAAPNPFAQGTEKSPPSAPISKKPDRAAEGTSKEMERRPSVREELREIRQERQQKMAPPKRKPIQHKAPAGKKKKTKAR